MSVLAALENDGIGRLRADLDARGIGEWHAAFDRETLSLLDTEARRARADAELVERTSYELDTDGQKMRSPMRLLASSAGDLLKRIHESQEMTDVASRLMGRVMRPSETAWLYFREGDFIGLHLDLPACQLTFLLPLDRSAPPLVVHPELRATDPVELLDIARQSSGSPRGGLQIPLPTAGLLALDGRVAPHQTRPVDGRTNAVVATLCYAGGAT